MFSTAPRPPFAFPALAHVEHVYGTLRDVIDDTGPSDIMDRATRVDWSEVEKLEADTYWNEVCEERDQEVATW